SQFKNHKALSASSVSVGLNNPDDAGVVRTSGENLIQSIDFFTPILDNPYDWGRVAAANALSDIYAMGGEPLSALQLVCWPRDHISFDILGEVIRGGLDVMEQAKCLVIGGHSIDDNEPKYGFSVTGVAKERVFLNNTIKDGDKLFLSKPLGTGVISTAIKKGKASSEIINKATTVMTTLNNSAADVAHKYNANAVTDITGFGLFGHLSEMLKNTNLGANIYSKNIPAIEGVQELILNGFFSSGSQRNLDYVKELIIDNASDQNLIKLCCDAQTSGGLLIAVPKDQNIDIVEIKESMGLELWEIGEINTDYIEKINII
ncbi:selenide, water dikinase SelD, partial [Acidimicrobiaceae bacterium]|nr:selenide, water dikinase SelD [Acidimicrobiaceae bacterium]